MKLVVKNGMVDYLLVVGKDVVKTSTSEQNALEIIKKATTSETTTTHKGFPLFVDNKYYFPEVPTLTGTAPPKKPSKGGKKPAIEEDTAEES